MPVLIVLSFNPKMNFDFSREFWTFRYLWAFLWLYLLAHISCQGMFLKLCFLIKWLLFFILNWFWIFFVENQHFLSWGLFLTRQSFHHDLWSAFHWVLYYFVDHIAINHFQFSLANQCHIPNDFGQIELSYLLWHFWCLVHSTSFVP